MRKLIEWLESGLCDQSYKREMEFLSKVNEELDRVNEVVKELCHQLEEVTASAIHLRNENAEMRAALEDLVNSSHSDLGMYQARGQRVLDTEY